MSKLTKLFESLRGLLHHGPSMAPFHEAMIEAHDAAVARIADLEEAFKKREEQIEAWFHPKDAQPVEALKNPQYIIEPKEVASIPDLDDVTPPEQPASEPVAPAEVPPQSEAEPVAADPAITATVLQPQPDPVSAAPEEVPVNPEASAVEAQAGE